MISDSSFRLDQSQWLRSHGFNYDPFPSEAFRAETDPLFRRTGWQFFVEHPKFREVYSYKTTAIFISSGGGKTSLLNRIKKNIEQPFSTDIGKHLVVEYPNPDCPLYSAGLPHHIKNIQQLLVTKFKEYGLQSELLDLPPSRSTLKGLVAFGKASGIGTLQVLVELMGNNLTQQAKEMEHLDSLARAYDLMTLDGIAFKFFLPRELIEHWHLKEFPTLFFEWQKEPLETMLRQRLVACSSYSKKRSVRGLFDPFCPETIDQNIAQFGEEMGNPRAMWLLGRYFLVKHFEDSPDGFRSSDELINFSTFQWACETARQELIRLAVEWQAMKNTTNHDHKQTELYEAIQRCKENRCAELKKLIIDSRNFQELKDLLFSMGLKYERIYSESATLDEAVQLSIEYLQRQNKLDDIVQHWKFY